MHMRKYLLACLLMAICWNVTAQKNATAQKKATAQKNASAAADKAALFDADVRAGLQLWQIGRAHV